MNFKYSILIVLFSVFALFHNSDAQGMMFRRRRPIGPFGGPMMGPMGGPMMGPMGGPMMGPMRGPMMGPMGGPMMGPMMGFRG